MDPLVKAVARCFAPRWGWRWSCETPIKITNIRAGRKKPGLLSQHLASVNAAVAVGQAEVRGNAIGSGELYFSPRDVRPGSYHFAVGTAGSCTLVLQTVLPALALADGPSELTLEGGTHNPFAPPFDFLVKTFLPLLNRMGPTQRRRCIAPVSIRQAAAKSACLFCPSPH